ncbi:ORF6N domain-containing protein [Mucilaginibacter ginsenosidivorans]|uniref:ORF6N domain-containing protein n=1 Tax=Mucilaginibacter ginsenosidivorans TaxID=398053 RepID=A0A5B8V2I6_9SPHI|nr:ORF6N domain-containing protein [Mucilaginibacter ginsenosidivorans]
MRRAVAKNPKRFPPDFIFLLAAAEWEELKRQIGPAAVQSVKQVPYAFTEAGVLML